MPLALYWQGVSYRIVRLYNVFLSKFVPCLSQLKIIKEWPQTVSVRWKRWMRRSLCSHKLWILKAREAPSLSSTTQSITFAHTANTHKNLKPWSRDSIPQSIADHTVWKHNHKLRREWDLPSLNLMSSQNSSKVRFLRGKTSSISVMDLSKSLPRTNKMSKW